MTSRYSCTEERFLKDIAEHQMTIIHDDGVNRHLRFKKPTSSPYWFDVLTWNGVLCINGDMGTFVFSRITDMFAFFRMDATDWNHNKAGGLSINPSYWAEKLLAMPKGGYDEFSTDRFEEVVKEDYDRWCESNEDQSDKFEDLWEAIQSDVLAYTHDGQTLAMTKAMEFRHTDTGFQFVDFWDHSFTEYRFHYIWVCYAVAWAVRTYDTVKTTPETTKEIA
jgi:hypothetical protein